MKYASPYVGASMGKKVKKEEVLMLQEMISTNSKAPIDSQ